MKNLPVLFNGKCRCPSLTECTRNDPRLATSGPFSHQFLGSLHVLLCTPDSLDSFSSFCDAELDRNVLLIIVLASSKPLQRPIPHTETLDVVGSRPWEPNALFAFFSTWPVALWHLPSFLFAVEHLIRADYVLIQSCHAYPKSVTIARVERVLGQI